MSVVIRGGGIAAATCEFLLRTAGFSVANQPSTRQRLPAIMLGESSQALFRDIFELDDVFAGLPRIQKRVVKWTPHGESITIPHSAVVVSEQLLLATAHSKLGVVRLPPEHREVAWTILSAPPLPEASVEHGFGSRNASIVPVQLKNSADPTACWIESLADGWLFLIPSAPGSAWLVSVGAPLNSHLESSRLVAVQIGHLGTPAGQFPSHPRIMWPLSGPGWLACGTAALGFDPLCGEGTGHAIREAILAAAIIRAAAGGADVNELVNHYQSRLLVGFKRHLALSLDYYKSGGTGPWWESAVAALRQGLAWCDGRLDRATPFRYRLNGFELEAVR